MLLRNWRTCQNSAAPFVATQPPGPSVFIYLARICPVGHAGRMESVFEIIAEPNRRAILSLLASSQLRRFWSAHVYALERHLDRMDQSAPTKRKTGRRR